MSHRGSDRSAPMLHASYQQGGSLLDWLRLHYPESRKPPYHGVFHCASAGLSGCVNDMGSTNVHTQALDFQTQRVGQCLQTSLATIIRGMQWPLNRSGQGRYEENV